jgi:MFS family permease
MMHVNASFFILLAFFEVPTGAYADRYGRKASTTLGWLICSLGMAIYAYAHTFTMCAVAEGIMALGMTFISGAFRAWMIDQLAWHDSIHMRDDVTMHSNYWQRIGGILASIPGAYLGSLGSWYPYAGCSLMFLTLGVSGIILLKEAPIQAKVHATSNRIHAFFADARLGYQTYTSSPELKRLFAVMGVHMMTLMAPNMLWPLLYRDYFGGQQGMWKAWFLIQGAILVGAILSRRALIRFRHRWSLLLSLQSAVGIAIIFSATADCTYSLIAFVLHECGRGMFDPIRSAYVDETIHVMNANIQGATLRSFDSIVSYLGGFIGLLTGGFILAAASPSFLLAVSGALLAASGVFWFLVAHKRVQVA